VKTLDVRNDFQVWIIHIASIATRFSRAFGRRVARLVDFGGSDRQPHELINCATGDRLIRTYVVAGPDLNFARVMSVLDAAVSVAAAEPFLRRPAVERIAPFPH